MTVLKPIKRPKISIKLLLADPDFWVGFVLMIVGLFAWMMANNFDQRSQAIPLTVSRLLVVIGFIIAVRTITRVASPKNQLNNLLSIIPIILSISVWAIALSLGLGFIISTFLLQSVLLWLSGIHNLPRLFSYAFVITTVGYVLFALILNIRFPNSLFSYIAQGL